MLLRSVGGAANRPQRTRRRYGSEVRRSFEHDRLNLDLPESDRDRAILLDDLTLGGLPPKKETVRFDSMTILFQGEWQTRQIILTNQDVVIALPGRNEVSDRIPLHEIKLVAKFLDNSDDLLMENTTAFNVHTVTGGYNCGREYCFRAENTEQLNSWLSTLSMMSKAAAKRIANRTRIQKYQNYVRRITSSDLWQRTNSILITANLILNIAQSQAVPQQGSKAQSIFDGFDFAFTIVFAIELVLHLFAYWFWPFFSDGWLVFDFMVVTVSVASLMLPTFPGVSILRLVRTFRVLRLFNRLRALRTLINALAASVIPVLNAFLMVILVYIMYAILGVELFGVQSPTLFGNFGVSYWTMFEVSTFDGWSEKARALSENGESVDAVAAIFLSTFIFVVCWVLLPVVVAVLLDNFVRAVSLEKMKLLEELEDARMRTLGVSKARGASPLDPLLEVLSRFKNSEDLSRRIGILFRVLDQGMSKTVDFTSMQEGLRKMDHLEPRIHLSIDDFRRITKDGLLCDAQGKLTAQNFETILRSELQIYIHGRIAQAHEECSMNDNHDTTAILAGIKLLLMNSQNDPEMPKQVTDRNDENVSRLPPSFRRMELIQENLLAELKAVRKELHGAHLDILDTKRELLKGRDIPSCTKLEHDILTLSQKISDSLAEDSYCGSHESLKSEDCNDDLPEKQSEEDHHEGENDKDAKPVCTNVISKKFMDEWIDFGIDHRIQTRSRSCSLDKSNHPGATSAAAATVSPDDSAHFRPQSVLQDNFARSGDSSESTILDRNQTLMRDVLRNTQRGRKTRALSMSEVMLHNHDHHRQGTFQISDAYRELHDAATQDGSRPITIRTKGPQLMAYESVSKQCRPAGPELKQLASSGTKSSHRVRPSHTSKQSRTASRAELRLPAPMAASPNVTSPQPPPPHSPPSPPDTPNESHGHYLCDTIPSTHEDEDTTTPNGSLSVASEGADSAPIVSSGSA